MGRGTGNCQRVAEIFRDIGDEMTIEEKKRIVQAFCDQYKWLRVVFDEYQVLYESGEERVRLLEDIARNFFGNLQNILVQYVLLNMCKFTDRTHFHQDDNLTVQYILEMVGSKVSKEMGLDKLAKEIYAIKPYIVEARNKRIAHFDREVLASSRIVGAFPRKVGDSFWESLRKFVDRVHDYYFGSIIGDVINNTGARDLVGALKKAVDYNDYFKQRENRILMLERRQKMRYKDA